MLSTASRTSRARLPRSGGLVALAPSTAVLLQSTRRPQQCRELSCRSWSSYFKSDSNKDGRRRHRMARYRYMESLNLRDSSTAHNSKGALKKAMAQFAARAEAGGQYTNLNDVKSWSDDLTGGRPGKNIEDVERGAIDHLLNGDKAKHYDYESWKSPLNNIRNYLYTQHAPEAVKPEDVLHATTAVETDSTSIDPITNRRTPKHQDISASKSQPAEPKYDDLDKYKPVRHNEPDGEPKPSVEEQTKEYDDIDKYGPVTWNEPDGLPRSTAEENSKDYKDLHKYSASKFDDPLRQRKLTPEEQSKVYDDLDQYKPVHWNEPDGLRKQTVEELSKDYDDLHKYGAVHWNEPDGLRKPTPEELSKNYQDLGAYGAVVWSEPDGLRRLTPEELSKNYDDLDAYSSPHTAKDSTLSAHEAAQMDRTVKGSTLASKVEAPVENWAEKYDDLRQYGPVRWNEPDGLRKLTPEELSKKYEDLHLYGAVKWNEPNGLRASTPEEQSKKYDDVPKYAPRDLPGPSKRIHPEEASKRYKDLSKYDQYENGDSATDRVHPEEATKQYEDLHKYRQYKNAGPEVEWVHPEEASKEYKDLSKYAATGFQETEKTRHIHPEELTKDYKDLGNYKPSVFDSPDLVYPVNPVDAAAVYKDLHGLGADEHSKPLGKSFPAPGAVLGGLEELDSKAGSQLPEDGPFTHHFAANRLPNLDESSVDDVDNLTAEDIRASTLRRAWENHPLTGNFVRDFPEEFTTSWSTRDSLTDSSLLPGKYAAVSAEVSAEVSSAEAEHANAEQDHNEAMSMDESFPSELGKLEPALDRQIKNYEVIEDSISHEPRMTEERRTHTPTTPLEPVTYKILAYDPTSQTVGMAETTSTAHTEAVSSNPADVLVRLTTPSKFLPYFQTLESQGYEIASGSGDVLIFRKTRAASTGNPSFAPETTLNPTRVNPIDMMGKPAVGNFASPTGFVNYDMVEESTHKPAPPFRSTDGMDRGESSLSRQRPVEETKKRSLGKKLAIGTVWIAGSAYAVGALAENLSARGLEAEARPRRGSRQDGSRR